MTTRAPYVKTKEDKYCLALYYGEEDIADALMSIETNAEGFVTHIRVESADVTSFDLVDSIPDVI